MSSSQPPPGPTQPQWNQGPQPHQSQAGKGPSRRLRVVATVVGIVAILVVLGALAPRTPAAPGQASTSPTPTLPLIGAATPSETPAATTSTQPVPTQTPSPSTSVGTPTPPPTPSPTPPVTPTPLITPSPTPSPAATPSPTAEFVEFYDDTYTVPSDLPPGTYRTRDTTDGCYWARLKGFGGSTSDIIANDFATGYVVVTIKATDKGFESDNCGMWSSDLSQVTASDTSFGEGTFIVGVDMQPGTYQSSAGEGCYWARLKAFSGSISDVIANDFRTSGHATVTIKASDKGFQSSSCGDWTRQ
jgi:hypothetical protein